MDYQKIYNQIIERGKTRILEEYKERHHIIPRCMGGTDEDDNIVELTAKEHFIVHKLLTEIYPNENGLHYAVFAMCHLKNEYHERTYTIGAREYQRLRENLIVSDETRERMRIAQTGKKQSIKTIQKRTKKLKGQTRTDEFKQLISKRNSGKVPTEEHRRKISRTKKGNCYNSEKTMSEEQKKKISESMKRHFKNK